jgi:DNA-binding SARP family transcriptional activator
MRHRRWSWIIRRADDHGGTVHRPHPHPHPHPHPRQHPHATPAAQPLADAHPHSDHTDHTDQTDHRDPPKVDITVLGGFGVVVDGVVTPNHGWSRRSAAALVKVLALAPDHGLHREVVMDLLWPHDAPSRSAPRLHKAAHFARRAAGRHDAVVLRDDVVWLFPGADVTVDAIRFEQLARVAVAQDDQRAAREALTWYRGELLPADRYEDWAADRRELLALRRLDVLRVAEEWRELAELDPTDEEAHTQLMERQLAAGAASAALRQYEHLERVLERELGVEPGETARRARLAATRAAARADEAQAPVRVGTLLAELADLVNRQSAVLAELARIGESPTLAGSSAAA